jgi:hypothetical protein
MTATRKRPHGFHARSAQRECDGTLPWSRIELIRMDRAFCDAMRREIARGTEQAGERTAKPAASRPIRQFHPAPRRSGSSSPAAPRADSGKRERMW